MSKSRLVDYWARAEEGEIYDEQEFDLKIFWKNLKKITKKYDIAYDDQRIVPGEDEDGGLLDRIFQAGKALLLETGVFCISTGRIIRFAPWEVEETLRLIPDRVVLGEGNDQVEVKYRGRSSKVPPPILGRVLGLQSPEIIEKVFESFAKEPVIDIFHFQGVIGKVYGVPVRVNSPFEMVEEVARTTYAKNALRKSGRTGAYDGASVPVSVRGTMVGFDPRWGKTSFDGAHSYLMPPMKVDYDQLTRVYFCHLHGIKFWTTASVRIRGMDGPPEMAVVSAVAQAIGEQMVYQPPCQQFAAAEMDYSCYTSRTALWVGLHAGAAFNRNTRCAFVRANPGGMLASGLGKEHFWEVGASALGSTVNNLVVSAGTGRLSAEKDFAAGISARFAGEVAHAAAGMDKGKANELLLRFLEKYEDRIRDKTLHKTGKTFQECYDLKRVVPNTLILEEMGFVKKEMRGMGFDIF
jgi:methylamine--corrinoid protein Co-methyltransferase